MPNSTLPGNTYLGDGQRTTAEIQTGLNQVAAWLNAAQAELNALSGTTLGEAAVRGVGTGPSDLVQTSRLDTRLGTGGNLGAAATRDVGTATDEVPLNSDLGSASLLSENSFSPVALSGDFSGGEISGYKIGDIVVLFISGPLQHASSSIPISSAVIPAAFRPLSAVTDAVGLSTTVNTQAQINSTGEMQVYYRDPVDGSNSVRSGLNINFSVSYTV